jgi:arsenate reductase (thioredoxin)
MSDVDRTLWTQRANPAQLSTEQQLQIKQSAQRLQHEFEGRLNAATIERAMEESLATLVPRARDTTWIPLLAERFTRDRLRALVRLESAAGQAPSVLFLCVHNAGRSQMAAGWMRHLAGDRIDVFSAGSEPAESINRAAVAVMAEKGIDVGLEIPQPWSDEIVRAVDIVVTMGCGDACPVFPGKRYVDWELDDPAGKPVEKVRPIRDELEQRVRTLMAELGVTPLA